MTGLTGQITGTPAVQGYDCILANIIKDGTVTNISYEIKWDELTDEEKACVTDFTNLLINKAEQVK